MSKEKIVEKMIEINKDGNLDKEDLVGECRKASELLKNLEEYPHAFVIGCILDRQVKAETAWIAPYKLQKRIGDFEFETLTNLSEREWEELFKKPEPLHRFTKIMPKLLYKAVKLIAEKHNCNAANIWKNNPSSQEVVYRFLQFEGVGQKIATMATKILKNCFKIEMSDYSAIDISADVHVQRVFYRLGLIPEKNKTMAIDTARRLYPSFPGILDTPAWHIGRNWCKSTKPLCSECCMNDLCPKQDI